MTPPRSRREKGGETGVDGATRLASFGVLVGVVFGVILLGATLRTDNTRDPTPSEAHLADTALPPAQRLEPPPAAREAIPAPLSEFPGLDRLAAEIATDIVGQRIG